ncbi:MAG: BrnT family toxin [Candidatus Firestonebacteria bacterium]|nr:BrnT family toxin [Candidatus Firestonebacteria bacterium]
MKHINWNTEKSKKLKELRGICFEDVVFYIEKGILLDDYLHPNQKRYSGQRVMVIGINNYAYLVPYVENENEIFLKTIIPSRKATEIYLGERK